MNYNYKTKKPSAKKLWGAFLLSMLVSVAFFLSQLAISGVWLWVFFVYCVAIFIEIILIADAWGVVIFASSLAIQFAICETGYRLGGLVGIGYIFLPETFLLLFFVHLLFRPIIGRDN